MIRAGDLLDLSQRRTRFVLRRLAWLMPQATVTMSDVNGPRGGIDKHCQVELKTDVAGTVVVTSVARDWRSALDKAPARAARFVLRLVGRGGDSSAGTWRARQAHRPLRRAVVAALGGSAPARSRPDFADFDHGHADAHTHAGVLGWHGQRKKSWLIGTFD